MNATKKHLLITITSLLIIILSVYPPCNNIFFDYSVIGSRYIISISLFVMNLHLVFSKTEIKGINSIIIGILLLLVWHITRTYVEMPLHTHKLLQPISVLVSILFFCKIGKKQQIIIDIALILTCLIISVHIVLQYFVSHVFDTLNYYNGPFDNPAGTAFAISSIQPLQIHYAIKYNKYSVLIFIISLISLTAIIITGSRTSILTCCIILWLYMKKNDKFDKPIFVASSIILSTVFVTLVFKKFDSIEGRLLIWKHLFSSIDMVPLFGCGPYGLTTILMDSQSSQSNIFPTSEQLLLDNIYYPYNELISAYITNGPLFCIGLVIILVLTIKIAKKDSPYFYGIFAFIIFSMFSYPSRYPFLWLVFSYYLVMSIKTESDNLIILKSIKLFDIIFSIILIITTITDLSFEFKWKQISNSKNESVSNSKTISSNFLKISEKWNGNPLFLYEFASELNLEQNYIGSNIILEQSERYIYDYNTTYLKGENYIALEEYEQAIACFDRCHKMCPAKIAPLYRMLIIYQNIDENKAIEMSKKIINYPEKIDSDLSQDIRDYAYNYLQQ